MKSTPQIQWPINPAFAPAPLHPKFKLEEPLHPIQIEGLRRMTPAQKFRQIEGLYCFAVGLKRSQLRKTHPDWNGEQLEREARRAVMHAPD